MRHALLVDNYMLGVVLREVLTGIGPQVLAASLYPSTAVTTVSTPFSRATMHDSTGVRLAWLRGADGLVLRWRRRRPRGEHVAGSAEYA